MGWDDRDHEGKRTLYHVPIVGREGTPLHLLGAGSEAR